MTMCFESRRPEPGASHQPMPASFRPRALRIGAVLVVAAALAAGCTKTQRSGDSPSFLVIKNLGAASIQSAGATSPSFVNVLASDVCVHVSGSCTVFDDLGQVSLGLQLRDPGPEGQPLFPSQTNFITVTRYHIDYIRADGRNTQGVDVPYSFDGAVTVTADQIGASATFTLVRVQAKEEAPLRALRNLASTVALSVIAQVTFYGNDQAGHPSSVTGQIEVNFADWADPASGGSGS